MSGALVPVSRPRRRGARQVGGVDPIPSETTAEIVRDVREHTRRQEAEISRKLQGLVAIVTKRHHERALQLVPIGDAMTRSTLDDWIEIGQRMLAAKGGRL